MQGRVFGALWFIRMSLLLSIQNGAISEDSALGPLLLKTRLLASKLDNDVLADWVKYESSGYPKDVPVPEYRKVGVSYRGTFTGPYNSGISNAQIPSYLIEKFCGKQWVRHEMRASVSGLQNLVRSSEGGSGQLQLGNTANLIPLLQGKVYEDYACNDIQGIMSESCIVEALHAVRSLILELCIKITDEFPEAIKIEASDMERNMSDEKSGQVTNIVNQTVYGTSTTITSSGDFAHINIDNDQNSSEELFKTLAENGILEADAKTISEIIASEKPSKGKDKLGKKAQNWLLENLQKAVDGTWEIGISAASDLVTKAAARYYGLE